ncbi:MAG: carbon-nitrogen hydrolase family protein [Chthoniobacterales bacterium]|nr:carbon-nitrogen hydrolase family protein [Chthoniobacterales bacterium]
MKVTICEFPDEDARKKPAWDALVEHVAAENPHVVVLPEMPFCEWIFVGDKVDRGLWRKAIADHDEMIDKFDSLACGAVMTSRPVERDGRRLNEAFVWSRASGYQTVRSKWYLPDVPAARETLWFDQGDRNFTAVPCGSLRAGFQLCSEIMFPEHARDIGFADAHLIAHPRASGGGQRWRAACEISAVLSGCYLVSANRRSYDRDLFTGTSWLFSPDAALLGETTAAQPFVTAEIVLAVAERAKTTYPRDMQRTYCGPGVR